MVHPVRQDLSIAGKRAGLAGARSGLYMEQIRIIREMREHDRTNGRTGEFKRLRPGDTVWLSKMFYTRPKKPVPVTVDAIRIDVNGTTYITGRKRFCEEAIGRTVFLTEEAARKALQEME